MNVENQPYIYLIRTFTYLLLILSNDFVETSLLMTFAKLNIEIAPNGSRYVSLHMIDTVMSVVCGDQISSL